MKKLTLLTFFIFGFLITKAQNKHEKIEAAKIAHITKEVSLTPAQAEEFWPLYNEYSNKRKRLRREKRQLHKESKNTQESDASIIQKMDRIEDIKMQELALDKSYRKQFLVFLSPQQVMDLYQAERDFFKLLKDQIRER